MRRLKTCAATCFILTSAVLCLYQFKSDHLLPFGLGCLALVPVWWLAPSWRLSAISVPTVLMAALLIDAFLFQHRLAVEARAWEPVWDIDEIEGILASPSGRSTAYVVGSHWLDSGYRVYLSARGVFPHQAYIETTARNAAYPRDIKAVWNGPLFTAGDNLLSVAFDERTGKVYTYDEWTQGPVSITDPLKAREAFSIYIQTMR